MDKYEYKVKIVEFSSTKEFESKLNDLVSSGGRVCHVEMEGGSIAAPHVLMAQVIIEYPMDEHKKIKKTFLDVFKSPGMSICEYISEFVIVIPKNDENANLMRKTQRK